MKLTLKRDIFQNEFTLGGLEVDGQHFCFTVEDKVRPDGVKIHGMTAIPAGTYQVILTMSARFKKVLPLLVDVPNFSGVRIHSGNTAEDTEGCIIVGMVRTDTGVALSRDAMAELMPMLTATIEMGEEVEIEIG
jgi:Family of unknown function (DUF5675)